MDNNQENFKTDSIVSEVINNFEERAKMGFKKYGTDLDRSDLTLEDYIQHALEEHMDAILYLTKALRLLQKEQTKCYCGHTTTCDCGPKE